MNCKIKINKNNCSKIYFTFLIFMWPALVNIVYGVLIRILDVEFSREIMTIILWGISLLFFMKNILKQMKLKYIITYCFFILIFIISYLITDYSYFTFYKLIYLITAIVPCYFIGVCFDEFYSIEKSIYSLSIFTLLINIGYIIFSLKNGKNFSNENMDLAYTLLPSICFITSLFLDKICMKRGIIFITAVIVLLGLGTRGPIFCLCVFLVMKLYKKYGKKKFIIWICTIFLGFFILVLTGLFEQGVRNISGKLSEMGLSTRVVNMLLSDKITNDNGRNIIKETLNLKIAENPMYKGYGIYSDREFTIGLYDRKNTFMYIDGTYAHNLITELKCDFGILWTYIILTYLIILFIRALIYSKNKDVGIFLVSFVCGFIHLFVSGSYLNSPYFFFLIGLSMKILTQNKYLKKLKYKEKRYDRYK